MIILRDANLTTDQFDYDPRAKRFVAEASEIGFCDFHRIYDDACDVGLAIRSDRTGQTATFYLSDEKLDADGDVQVWVLKPIAECLRKQPQLAGVEVHILND